MPDAITQEDLKKYEKKQTKALKELRETFESKTLSASDQKEKIEKIEKDLGDYEDFCQKVTAGELERKQLKENYEQLQKDLEEKTEMLKALERKAYRLPGGDTSKEVEAEMLEVKTFMQKGEQGLRSMELKYLRTDSDVEGGYLVPPAPLQTIMKKITEISDMRAIARVITTSYNEVPFPIRVNNLAVEWVGEGEQDSLTNQRYGMERVQTHILAATVPITSEELQDSQFNMDTEIFGDTGEAIAQKEGAAFVNGDAVKKPEGFLQNSNIEVKTSSASGTFTGDDLADLDAELKTDYRNPVRLVTRKTLNHIRKLKSGAGDYLLTGLRDGLPPTINGYMYKEMSDMEEIAASSKVMAFGDFMKGIVIVDRIGLTMIRDPYSRKREGIIELTFRKRVGGQVILPEAIKILQCAA